MWASEKQQCQVIRELLGNVHLERLWTDEGPTDEAYRFLKAKRRAMSHGEAIMLQVAFDLWNRSGNATVGDLVTVLDDGNLRAVLAAIAVCRPVGG